MTALAPPVPRAPATAVADAATWSTVGTLRALDVEPATGVRDGELTARQARSGPNAVASHRARMWPALGLTLRGLLVASDPHKDDAAAVLGRLRDLGITVKVVTGDAAPVAVHVCRQRLPAAHRGRQGRLLRHRPPVARRPTARPATAPASPGVAVLLVRGVPPGTGVSPPSPVPPQPRSST